MVVDDYVLLMLSMNRFFKKMQITGWWGLSKGRNKKQSMVRSDI